MELDILLEAIEVECQINSSTKPKTEEQIFTETDARLSNLTNVVVKHRVELDVGSVRAVPFFIISATQGTTDRSVRYAILSTVARNKYMLQMESFYNGMKQRKRRKINHE